VQERLEDLTWEQIGPRMADPNCTEAIRYLQHTLGEEMERRGADKC
jgi:hypothetical protein